MYLRTTPRRNHDGSVVRYLQLAHNTWDPTAKRSRVQDLYNFGREDANNRATLLDLEVDLLFFDTTSTYFELDEADTPIARDQHGHRLPQPSDAAAANGVTTAGFRSYGHSKDHRDDLPQIVVGMAVTRTGIPVRVWCWPGNTTDSALIRQVKADLRDWTLARVIWVADRGFASAENRRYL